MLEIPETNTIANQAEGILQGKTITNVVESNSPHKFAFYSGTIDQYKKLLINKKIESAIGHGDFITLKCNSNTNISISSGANMKYFVEGEPYPKKHQLLIEFDDNSFLAFTVSMYGCIFAFEGVLDNPYYKSSLYKVSPLSDDFNMKYFNELFKSITKNISVKAFLGTEQRIPGLGNGVLQDIFFKSGLHPKRKISTLSDLEKGDLFHCLKFTLQDMTDKGGRDTERDFFGCKGSYKCLLSKNTYKEPCPLCGFDIIKEAYLGGTIYYCPKCQQL